MSILGTVENGVVKLPADAGLADGTTVRVETVEEPAAPTETEKAGSPEPTLAERLAPWIGIAEGLPEDLAINHDHYLYGTPKRRP